MNTVYIARTETTNTGGNCMADLIELKSGRVLYVTDECIGVCDSRQHWSEGPVEDFRDMDYDAVGGCERVESGALTFVKGIDTYEPDGPVSVDLVELADGRVIGIDGETAVLYPSRKFFDESEGEPVELPALDLQ